jgi:hypothetical protein
MKVVLAQGMASPAGCFGVGDVVDLPDEQARALIKSFAADEATPADIKRANRSKMGAISSPLLIDRPNDAAWTDPDTLGGIIERDEALVRRARRVASIS